jgi:hypothetical protein
MGLLDGLKKAFNIGGAQISLELPQDAFHQGEKISGLVIITGSDREVSGDKITAELEEYWTETRGSGKNRRTVTIKKTRDYKILEEPFTIEPGAEYNYEFTLKLPLNSRMPTNNTGWNLKVNLDIPMALDPHQTIKLKLLPAKEFLAITGAMCAKLGFQENHRKSGVWKANDSSTYMRIDPSEDLKREFDYIAFELRQTSNGIAGKTIYNLQEKKITDYLKAAVGMDCIKEDIHLSMGQIFMPDGNINIQEITAPIEKRIQEIIAARDPYNKSY